MIGRVAVVTTWAKGGCNRDTDVSGVIVGQSIIQGAMGRTWETCVILELPDGTLREVTIDTIRLEA